MNKELISDISKICYTIDLPTKCPHCDTSLVPEIFESKFSRPRSKRKYVREFLDMILYCPNCDNRFFSSYGIQANGTAFRIGVYPPSKPTVAIPDILLEKYPDFAEAYTQAAIAETYNLIPLCGMGYRRALEILIKQYLISIHPNEEETIINEPLSKSYNRLNDLEKSLARGATWLGNDYVHMINKHPEYGLDDLKKYIHSLSHLITAYLTSEEADNVPHA